MNVLILTSHFGNGHYQAAQTLAMQLRQLSDVKPIVVDLIGLILDEHKDSVYEAYGSFVNKGGSGLFNLLYKHTNNGELQGFLPLKKSFTSAIRRLVVTHSADMLIATYSAAAMAASAYKKQYHHNLPLITCITDVISHNNWLTPQTDGYLVAAPLSKQLLTKKGVAAEKIFVTGIPVDEVYHHLPRHRQGAVRRLLVMGGGCGLLPKQMSFYETLNCLPQTETTILTGRNEALRTRLSGQFEHIEVVGYTNQVPQYMAQADVLLSKAGGLSIFEAIYSEKPLLLFHPNLVQEVRNSQFMISENMAFVLPKQAQKMSKTLSDVLHDELQLKRMTANMRRFKEKLEPEALIKWIVAYDEAREAL